MTYRELWQRLLPLYDAGEAKAIARMVYEMRFGLSLTDLCIGKETQLSANDQAELADIARRLLQQEPVQYVLGVADFCGRSFVVNPSVLIPRPETAELCRHIVASTSDMPRPLHMLDIGTGSGCIAVTLALDIPDAQVMAWDISEDAVDVARENARRLGADVLVCEYNAQAAGAAPNLSPHLVADVSTWLPVWDVIVSNPPYIFESEQKDMAPSVLNHEPHLALFAPSDNPWWLYHSIISYASKTLRPGGQLYLETNPLMADQLLSDVVAELGSCTASLMEDSYGKQRFVFAQKD